MKKFYLGALGCLLAMGASAQKVEQVGTMQNSFESLRSIPTEYAYDGKPSIYTINEAESAVVFTVYNKSFAVDRTIRVANPTSYDRKVVEKREWDENTQKYTGEWVKEEELYSSESLHYMLPIHIGQIFDPEDVSLLFATQTFFNNDEKWEFLRPVYTETINPNSYYTYEKDRDGDGEIDYKQTRYENKMKAYEVVSEDGNVLTTIAVPEADYYTPLAIQWDGETYFGISVTTEIEEDEDYYYERFTNIYSIDKNASRVKEIASTPAMRVSPALAERNSTVNVTLDAETAKNGGELVITDSNGRTVGRSYVEAGQTSVPVTTDRMGSGVYNITLTEKGQKVENARIIVK